MSQLAPQELLVAYTYAAGEAAVWRDSDGGLWLTDDASHELARKLSKPIDRSAEAAIEIDDHGIRYVVLGGVLPRAAAGVKVRGLDGIDYSAKCENGCWLVAFADECGLPLEPIYMDRQGDPL